VTAAALRAPVPSGIIALIAAVAIGGTLAGFVAATPLLLVTSPVVAAGLAAAAVFGQRKPEWHRLAVDALARLPGGNARMLLADLLRRAEAVPAAAHAGPLAAAACDAARQLCALEVHLAAFEAQQGTELEPSPRWRDALARCRRGSALLTQRLQDASAALSRWQAAQGAGESLGELARELNDESRYQQDAAHEVELLLA
jgi:hypothetical protein